MATGHGGGASGGDGRGSNSVALCAAQGRGASDPLAHLPFGGGRSAKPARDCTELCLSRCGIGRLASLQHLTNLQALWLDGNALPALEGLDANTRLRELYLHGNRLCTLRGSLPMLRALTHLDLADNQLRDLGKVLGCLAALPALRYLNLQRNPCCEEPGYRLQAVGALTQVQVLDWRQVTDAERRAAALAAGRGAAALAAPFGRSLARGDAAPGAAWRARAPERSALEVELEQAAALVREERRAARDAADAAAYSRNPDAAFWEPRHSLPPPPGVERALQESMRRRRGTLQAGEGGACRTLEGGLGTATGGGGSAAPGSDRSWRGTGQCGHGGSEDGAGASGASGTWGACGASGRAQQQRGGGYAPRDLLLVARHAAAAGGGQPSGTVAHHTFGSSWVCTRDAVRV